MPPVGPSFEVASIRPANPDGSSGFGWDLTASGRFIAHGEPLFNLVSLAYVEESGASNIVGGPNWKDSFDINAKIDDAYVGGWDKLSFNERLKRVRPMLRALLAERFHLKLRAETKITPVYALAQAKGGAKLTEVARPSPETPEEQEARESGDPAAKTPPGETRLTSNLWTGNATPIANMVGLISALGGTDQIVIDATGLKGYYDFTFHFSRDRDGPTFLDQLERGLGLKLEPRKVLITTYVIESAEKPSVDGA
jgi:uncharacterized protein (TIGR03435 family)